MRTGSELYQAMKRLCGLWWITADGPWRFGDLAVATDGLVFVAVPASEMPGEVFGELPEKMRDRVAKMVGTALAPPVQTTAERLREFAGPPFVCRVCSSPEPPRCENCEGTGEVGCICECGHDHEAPCEDCDGKGKALCSCGSARRVVKIADRIINAHLLAKALAVLEPTGPVSVSGERVMGMDVLLLAGDSWRIVVAPINNYEPVAVFEPAA